MDTREWISGARLVIAFFLTPVIVPIWLALSVHVEFKILASGEMSPIWLMLFATTLVHFGACLAYVGAILFGLPCILFLLERKRLDFVHIMVASELLAVIYYLVLKTVVGLLYPVVPHLALYCVPAVIVSGLCFYLVGVWQPRRRGRNKPARMTLQAGI